MEKWIPRYSTDVAIHPLERTFHFDLSFLRCVITVPKKIFSPLIIYLEIEYYRSIVVIIFFWFSKETIAQKNTEKNLNEKFIDSPRSCRNSANHLSNTRVSPPLPFLSGSCRNSANNITAMKLSYVSPCGMILLNLPLSFRQVETLQLEETKQAFFFFLFSRETRRWRDCFLCLLLADYETVIRLPGSRLSRFISSPLVFSFFF